MADLYMMMSIVDRLRLPEFAALFKENGLEVSFISLGRGTATSEMLDYFGLENSEKAVIMMPVTGEKWKLLKKGMTNRIRIDIPGTGIALIVPMSSIGGRRELDYFTEGQNFTESGESTMKGTANEMLVIICNQGYSETAMEAARTAGARGGTVVHAHGTGREKAEQFLGISLASEKDIIYIVTPTEKKNGIMQNVMREAGVETKAGAIIFSLPVTDTAGLRLLDEEE